MARIRTIKPEFCVSEQIGEISVRSRLAFALMWIHCDDAGNHAAKPMQLKAEIFPFDPFTRADMEDIISELIDAGLVIEYQPANSGDSDARYWHVTGWHHQKIENPGKAKHPAFDISSVRITRGLGEGSGRVHRDRAPESSLRESKESKGSLEKKPRASARKEKSAVADRAPKLEEVKAFFLERGTDISAEEFFSYYEANGWRQSNGNPIKSWRHCLTTWEAREREKRESKNGSYKIPEDF